MKNEILDPVARAVQKARDSSFFLASILGEFQRQNNLSDKSLAALLDCEVKNLRLLELCRCPNPNQPTFASDVDHLANRFCLRASQLANIIRQVAALNELKAQLIKTHGKQGMLLAARDRDSDSTTVPGEDE